jgi:hypothetical protein
MDLATRLHEDMKTALKAGDKPRLAVIRMLLSDVKNIDLQPKKTTAEEAVAAYAKKLRKSQEEFQKYGKTDQVEQLKFEISVAESYLPTKASEQETEALLDQFLAGNAFTEKQFGQAMGAFLKANPGRVDAAMVNPMLKRKLESSSKRPA